MALFSYLCIPTFDVFTYAAGIRVRYSGITDVDSLQSSRLH